MLHICFDIDDVLNSLMEKWLITYNHRNLKKFKYEQIIENPPYEILGISKQEYLTFLDEYRLYSYLFLEPNKEILNWFKENENKAHFSVLTATPSSCSHISANWVMTYFKDYIRTFAFIPSGRENIKDIVYDKSKADWLIRNNADIFIDDNEKNINEAKEKGIKSYLVKQPWNSGENITTILDKLTEDINK